MKRAVLALLPALTVCLLGCGGGSQGGGGGPPGGGPVNVKAATVSAEPIEEKISLVASITANESIEVKSEIDGTVENVNFDEGQPVQEGQLLIKLDTRKWEASVAEADANFKLADANLRRAEAMLKNQTIALQEYDQAVATYEARKASLDLMRQQLKDARILARFAGLAGARFVSPGQVISRDTLLTTLIDIEPVKVEIRVPERFLGQLRIGQSIAFQVAAYPDERFHGEVYFIDPQVDLASRTVLVKARHANADLRLRPGMFGNVDLILQVRDQALLVPETAVMLQGEQASVFVIDDEGKAQPVTVTLGTRLPGRVEISSGLRAGQRVVTEGTQKIGPGSPVVVVEPAPDAPAAEPTAP